MAGQQKSPQSPRPFDTIDRGAQLAHHVDALGVGRDTPLGAKAARIVDGIVRIWEHNGGHFVRSDAEAIQALVLSELSPRDFKDIAKLSFANWATPARLAGPGLPHLNQINETLGRTVAALAKQNDKHGIRVLDLGAGLLSTTETVIRSLDLRGRELDLTAIDATPALVEAAQAKRATLLEDFPQVRIDLRLGDMLEFVRVAVSGWYDYVTTSFAIHHLHPTEQTELVREIYRALQPGGAFLVSDPQEGKSDFNLKTLIYEEPEAIFAAFTSPESMGGMLKAAGFEPVRVLVRDDLGYEGYAMFGLKPPH